MLMIVLMLIPVLLAPFLFVIATNMRSSTPNTLSYFVNLIIGRVSFIEIGGIELEQYVNGTYNKLVFSDKYGLVNQIKQTINSLVIGDVFSPDAFPNQYWRSVFTGWDLESAKINYTSMNMILPIYLIFKYSFLGGLILFLLLMGLYFRFVCRLQDKVLGMYLATMLFYTLFQFFDWPYHIRDIISIMFSVYLIRILSWFRITYTKKFYYGLI
jgi:hypothetical protein